MRIALMISFLLALLPAGFAAKAADGLFAPRVIVNNDPVSNFEVDQRVLFLEALNTPGDLEKLALESLIDDRLKLQAADAAEVVLGEEALRQGLTDFAGRANLSVEQFTQALADAGVEPETLRDFVAPNLVWREVVRQRFLPLTRITEGDIDRALDVTLQRGGVRVLLSEIIIPAPEGQEADALAQAQELRASIASPADFEAAAAQFSASPSAQFGGRIDWLDLGNLPPALREILIVLVPGQISPPIPIPNAVALFLMRGIEETGRGPDLPVALDYMQVLVAEGAGAEAEGARLRNGATRCSDLYGLTEGFPDSQVIRTTQTTREVPRDIALELAKLDPGESSFVLRRGAARVFLMLCSRNIVPEADPAPTREQINEQLFSQSLARQADNFLSQLRAAAVITEP